MIASSKPSLPFRFKRCWHYNCLSRQCSASSIFVSFAHSFNASLFCLGPYWLNTIVEANVNDLAFNFFCGQIEVIGKENLPDEETPCVYIFNHQSQADVAPCYALKKYCAFVGKSSMKFVPGIGQGMILGKHM
jgi:1-acyl-sn-glycerol-3-phosphate acyltransferase